MSDRCTSQTDAREVEFYEDLAWRLKLAVEALDTPKGVIAQEIGVSQQRLSNWITNQNKPDWFGVAKLCRRFNISADWVLLGDLGSLRHALAVNLVPAVEGRTAARAARPGQGRDSDGTP